jgi:hypothetical protein
VPIGDMHFELKVKPPLPSPRGTKYPVQLSEHGA